MRRSLSDFTTDDLKYLKIGSIVHAVFAIGLAWFLFVPLLVNLTAFFWLWFGEDWFRENVQGAMYASDVEIARAMKRDVRWIWKFLVMIGAGFYVAKLTYIDPAFYNPQGIPDSMDETTQEESSESDRTDN